MTELELLLDHPDAIHDSSPETKFKIIADKLQSLFPALPPLLKPHINECLVNGDWVEYWACSFERDAYKEVKNKFYLSKGHKIRQDGRIMDIEKKLYFWGRYE